MTKSNKWWFVVLAIIAIVAVSAILDGSKNRKLYKTAKKQIDVLVQKNKDQIDSLDAVRFREEQSYIRVLAIKQNQIDSLRFYISTTFQPKIDVIDERENKFLSSNRRIQFIEFGKLVTEPRDSI